MPFDYDGTTDTPDSSHDSSNKGSPISKGLANSATLRREVLNPTPHNTGVGVMLVASAAMFFAVASSAFILRSQQRQCAQQPSQPNQQRISIDNSYDGIEVIAVEVIDTDLHAEGIDQCGDPIIRAAKNNSTEIVFRVCPK